MCTEADTRIVDITDAILSGCVDRMDEHTVPKTSVYQRLALPMLPRINCKRSSYRESQPAKQADNKNAAYTELCDWWKVCFAHTQTTLLPFAE